MEKNDLDRIKYDLRDCEFYWGFFYITILVQILNIIVVLFYLTETDFVNNLLGIDTGFYAFLFIPILAIFSIGKGCLYAERRNYMLRLQLSGYVIPYRKKDYDCSLSKLPKMDECNPGEEICKQPSKAVVIVFVLTLVNLVISLIFTKTPHFIIIAIMGIAVLHYYRKTRKFFYLGELDKIAGDKKRLLKRKVLKYVEIFLLFIMLTIGMYAADWNLPVDLPIYYTQAMRYYKKLDPERYAFFFDKIPANAEDSDFYAIGTEYCCVYFEVLPEEIHEYCSYFENLPGVNKIMEGILEEEDLEFIRDVRMQMSPSYMWGNKGNYIVYQYEKLPDSPDEEYFRWYAVVHTDTGEVAMGFDN